MQALSEADVLSIWSTGRGRHPIDRALLILKAARPGASDDALSALPIPQRDMQLGAVRQALFGSMLQVWARCPTCQEELDVDIPLEVLVPDAGQIGDGDPVRNGFVIATASGPLRGRLPTSMDLAAALATADPKEALLTRCIDGFSGLSTVDRDGCRDAATQAMADTDPVVRAVRLACDQCESVWRHPFDLAAFLWRELEVEATRLMGEIHALARGYGWRETDAIAAGPARRRVYLEMLGV